MHPRQIHSSLPNLLKRYLNFTNPHYSKTKHRIQILIPKPMASAAISNSLCDSSLLPLLPYPRISPHRRTNRAAKSTTVMVPCASRSENLIVLRKRIHEMKMAEAEYEPPAHWMEREKNCYAGKDEFVCELVGLVQTQMMNARPGLVLGLILIVALSVPASAAALCFQMLALIKGVLPA